MTSRTKRETETGMQTLRVMRRVITTTIAVITLHAGVQLGAWAVTGQRWADPATIMLQGAALFCALVLLGTSSRLAGEVMPPRGPDKPPRLTARSLIGVTLLGGAALTVFGSLVLTDALGWTTTTLPPELAGPDGTRGVMIAGIAAGVGFMLWITACDWIRQRHHHRMVNRGR